MYIYQSNISHSKTCSHICNKHNNNKHVKDKELKIHESNIFNKKKFLTHTFNNPNYFSKF